MSEFRFAEPLLAHALWAVVAFVALLFWLEHRGGSALERLVGRTLQARLVERPPPWRRNLRVVLLGLAGVCAVLALMRPQWGMRVVASSRVGAEIMVALDVSRSMLAEDVAPNRLERAKAELVDLLSYLDGDQVGLIAFAGRASVLSPLTPDFGFLRLVLEGTGPGSVTRGGTRLSEPIRKAVAGFGASAGAARVILLITDGEDHDSFALDAAREAAEAGVRIIAIGFGDEAGSEIRVTDRRTGAQQLLRDADGSPVVSRLNGKLLRELALQTGGVYVPAGTGVLDLESIYDRHIARLTRGELDGQRTVRDEGYAWFVLLALVFLISSAAVSGGRLLSAAGFGRDTLSMLGPLAALLGVLLGGGPLQADSDGDAGAPLPAQDEMPAQVPGPDGSGAPRDVNRAGFEAEVADPRSIYNQGVEALGSRELEDAERHFSRARRNAGGDDVLRFHTSFNQGWVGVEQAARIRGEAPRDALSSLYRAADWFREAVELRPSDEDARHNLEVVLRRALVIADEIARNEEGGIDGELGELATRQREAVAAVAALLQRAAEQAADSPGDIGEALRGAFRARASAQRGILSDADQLAAHVAEEREAIDGRSESERSPEDAMRVVQLDNLLEYLHRARERMGQARRQLRERRASRAYRRTSAALAELKRALDQLRDPVSVLDQLLADGGELARSTALLALSQRNVPGLQQALPTPPAWLSTEALADDQASHAGRSGELQRRLLAGLEQAGGADLSEFPPEQAAQLESVRAAEPFVRAATQHSEQAASLLQEEELAEAPASHRAALAALADARERFLDLRGLIEATHRAEVQIDLILEVDTEGPGGESATAQTRIEYLPSLRVAQEANLARGERLEEKLVGEIGRVSQQMLAAESAAASPNTQPPDPEALAQRRQQLDIASQLLTLALAKMDSVQKGLVAEAPSRGDWESMQREARQAVDHLQSLRLLFFSIVEHVRELARRQIDVSDDTQDALALAVDPSADVSARTSKLGPAQRTLAEQTLVIANALAEQSDELARAQSQPESEDAATRLRAAGEHVLLAQGEMETAVDSIETTAELTLAREAQGVAVSELEQALAILEPPQPQGDEQQQGDSPQPQQQAGEQPQDEEGPEGSPQPQRAVDPAQMLQEVREREAQRRREQAQQQAGYESVEKDW